MAGLGELLQRIARDLEQAGGQQPGDDLRAQLGYGPADEAEDMDDEPALDDGAWEPETDRSPEVSRVSTTLRVAEVHGTSPLSTSATLPSQDAPPEPALTQRIRARMHALDTLREAFVIKELLDRPLGTRRKRCGVSGGSAGIGG